MVCGEGRQLSQSAQLPDKKETFDKVRCAARRTTDRCRLRPRRRLDLAAVRRPCTRHPRARRARRRSPLIPGVTTVLLTLTYTYRPVRLYTRGPTGQRPATQHVACTPTGRIMSRGPSPPGVMQNGTEQYTGALRQVAASGSPTERISDGSQPALPA